RLSDASSAATRVAQREVSEARADLFDFVQAWPARELLQRSLTGLAFREFVLEVQVLDLARAEAAALESSGNSDDSDQVAASRAVRRALGAAERAWQRYVHELTAYLDVIDVVV